MRNLTRTLAVVSLLASASAHPLGIGDIKLHSALNQNLNAEIPLVVSAGENVADIKVNLAPPDKFDEAGVPWSYFLSQIKFEQVVGANGSVVIKLSSREALKEPILDLLLEVSWPQGNLYREFTVLVDPPAAYSQATIPVSTSIERHEPEQDFMPQRQQAPRSQTRHQNAVGVERGHVIVNRNDTLWNVAQRANSHRDVAIEQMMVAIYQQNPDAFYKKNVNALMAGKKLKIPEKEAILKLSRKEALAEFNRQIEVWRNRADAPAPVDKSVPIDKPSSVETANAEEAVVDNHLKLVAPTEATVTEQAVIAAKSDQASAEKPAVETQQTHVEAATAAPAPANADEAASPDAAMQNKMAELENQLAAMQRLLALKDEQLAALQSHAKSPAAQQQAVQPPAAAEAAKPAAEWPLPKPEPAVQPEPESNGLYYLGVGGAGAGALSLLGWLWWRKRKVDQETNAESMFASSNWKGRTETDETLTVPIVEGSSSYNVGTVGESSFLSEFTPSDFGAFDTDQNEIDPISEADVYLAYGRYQQAEELMRHAIKAQPERDECQLKLLEIFYANENKQAFEAYAGELAAVGKKDEPEFWAKVAEMGGEICPESALFSSALAPNENADAEKSSAADLTDAHESDAAEADNADEMDFDLTAFEASPDHEDAQPKDGALDFDLTSFDVEDDPFVDDQKNNDSLDFDLNLLTQDTIETAPTLENTGDGREQAIESFDFSSSGTETKGPGEFDLSAMEADAAESFESFDFSTGNAADLNGGFDNDAFDSDFEFNFDLDDMPADASEKQGAGSDVSDLTDMDEWETKLDLAKAYIDMGDAEAARDIADEVYRKGSSEQKKMAMELLEDLK